MIVQEFFSPGFFITATDTDAGKTYVTALLTRSLRALGVNAVAMKPIASGSMIDSQTLHEAAEGELSLQEITPVFYQAPLAPLDAAPLEGKLFSSKEVLPTFFDLHKKYSSLLVEGVGGWLVPLSPTESLPDLARAMGFPVLVVVRNRLGALNHALLTLESIRHHGLHCAGIILNHHPHDQGDLAMEGYRRFFKNLCEKEKLPLFLEVASGQKEISFSQPFETDNASIK